MAEEDVVVKKEKHGDAVDVGTRRKKGGSRHRHRGKPRRTNTAVPKGSSSRRTSTARLQQMMERHKSTLSQGTAASEGSGGSLVLGTRKKKGKRGKGRGGTKLKGSLADRKKAKLRAKRAKERRQRRRTEQQRQREEEEGRDSDGGRQRRRASSGRAAALFTLAEEEEGREG